MLNLQTNANACVISIVFLSVPPQMPLIRHAIDAVVSLLFVWQTANTATAKPEAIFEEALSTLLINAQLYVSRVKYHQTLFKRFVLGPNTTLTRIMSQYLEANELSWSLYDWRLCSLFWNFWQTSEPWGIMWTFFRFLSFLRSYFKCRVQLF